MASAAQIVVGLVAAIHFYILVLEMFLWRTDRVRATFGTTEEFADLPGIFPALRPGCRNFWRPDGHQPDPLRAGHPGRGGPAGGPAGRLSRALGLYAICDIAG